MECKERVCEHRDGDEMSNRFKAKLYLESEYIFTVDDRYVPSEPCRHLQAEVKYLKKLHPEDLPEWYVTGRMYWRNGSISAKGVKHLLYVPTYYLCFAHQMYTYDNLFVSYGDEIKIFEGADGDDVYMGFDFWLTGPMIIDFVNGAEKYSGYDVTEIRKELERKKEWFYELNS